MCERVLVYDRCIAMQLRKETSHENELLKRKFLSLQPQQNLPQESKSLSLPAETKELSEESKQKDAKNLQKSLSKKLEFDSERECQSNFKRNPSATTLSPMKSTNSPLSSNSSGTPTPTNGVSPLIMSSNGQVFSTDLNSFSNYQEGYRLYQVWVATNAECVWDPELVKAVTSTHFVGFLVGGFILIGGPSRVIAAITHAYSRALLNSPPGWIIIVLGELRECEVAVVQRGQFTPLGDALCWSIHRLCKIGVIANQKKIHESLLVHFPSMAPPEPALIHAALTDLIRQRKVFYTGRGYRIVQANTYIPSEVTSLNATSPNDKAGLPPRLLTTSEALTKAHGTAEIEKVNGVTHASVQTDLADLLTGIWPNSSILIPREPPTPVLTLQRSGSFRGEKPNISNIFCERDKRPWQSKYNAYEAEDAADITIKGGEKVSVLTKILRVSQPRRRLASFSAQFPPQEWTCSNSIVKHLHSVATQTRSPRHPGGPESCTMPVTQWAPRSSTLPRKPSKHASSSPTVDVYHRPHSASPSPRKIAYNNNTNVSHFYQRQSALQMSSSPSPCITSTHSSRTTSPSLQSTPPSNHNFNPKCHSPYKTNSPKHKTSTSPKPKNKRNHSSPHHFNSQSNLPHNSPQRKPPPTSSPHHTYVNEQKKISSMSDEILTIEVQSSKGDESKYSHRSKSNTPAHPKIKMKSLKPVTNFSQRSKHLNEADHRHTENVNQVSREFRDQQTEKQEEMVTRECRKIQKQSLSSNDTPSDIHMNNYKKVVSSPQKPEGIKNIVFHENLSNIAKGSISDLTSKNLGYRDVNKCDKRLYSEETLQNGMTSSDKEICESEKESGSDDLAHISNQISKPTTEINRKLKLSLPLTESSNLGNTNIKKLERKLQRKGIISSDKKVDESEIIISPFDDIQSVKTYPSFSDLNLTFSSLTAQKILQGVSVNSIDTLVEVNMLAEKRKQPSNDGVTNTDFGFV